MKKMNRFFTMLSIFFILFVLPFATFAAEEKTETEEDEFKVPSHVLNIAKENTGRNEVSEHESVEPSEATKELLESAAIPIENDALVQLLNETTIKPSPIGIGYRGEIFLGRWPLHYESTDTTVNWEYQPINRNQLKNSSDVQQEMNYIQQENREVKGMLTAKIANSDIVRNMMLKKAEEKTNLPLSYHAEIGRNTKMPNAYPVPPNKTGVLDAFAPAVHEKGKVTFGEVFIELKGTKKKIVIKNVTKQEVGAWIPIQDHVSYSFKLK